MRIRKPRLPRIIDLHIKRDWLWTFTVIVASLIFALLIIGISQQQKVLYQGQQAAQERASNQIILLEAINNAVSDLENNSQRNHDATIKYIQCVVNLFVYSSHGYEVTQTDFDNCLAGSGVSVHYEPESTPPKPMSHASTNSSPPTGKQPTKQTPPAKGKPSFLDSIPGIGRLFKHFGL